MEQRWPRASCSLSYDTAAAKLVLLLLLEGAVSVSLDNNIT